MAYLDELTKEQKQEERDLIINNETYTKGQRQRILNYNKKDGPNGKDILEASC